jgi:hypothetical protein
MYAHNLCDFIGFITLLKIFDGFDYEEIVFIQDFDCESLSIIVVNNKKRHGLLREVYQN